MINIPYSFSGTVAYQSYEQVKQRAKNFNSTYEVFGLDQSGEYEMFFVSLGDSSKPCLFITTSMHPPEWQGMSYTFAMMEQLRDNTFPDESLRNELINNYYLVFVPIMQPWGLDRVLLNEYGIYQSGGEGRRNVNGVDLNSDFYYFGEQESKNIRSLGNRLKPFAYMDVHMYQPDYGVAYDRNAIVVSGQQGGEYDTITEPYVLNWKESMENYVGESITMWTNNLTETSGLARGHFARQLNPWTPFTLSYLTEIVRPAYRDRNGVDTLIRKLSDNDIYKYGMTHNYLFLKTSLMYFEQYGNENGGENGGDVSTGLVYKIETPQKTIELERNHDDVVQVITEKYKTHINHPDIKTTIVRNSEGEVIKVVKEEI